MKTLNPVCPHCGSHAIFAEGTLVWDKKQQTWTVDSIYGSGYCRDCDKDMEHIEWREDVNGN